VLYILASLNGTVDILTLQLATWPARSTCDRILKLVCVRRRRGARSSEAQVHKISPATSVLGRLGSCPRERYCRPGESLQVLQPMACNREVIAGDGELSEVIESS
jgi:hypothetical protein